MPRRQGTVSATIRHHTEIPAIAYHAMGQTVKPGAATTKFSRLTGLATIRHNSPPTMTGLPLATHHRNSLQLAAYHERGRVSRVSQQFFTTVSRSGLRCRLRYNGLAIGIKVYRAIQRFSDRNCGLKLNEQRYRHMRICA
jgi:hypothetical protein